jgi:hypothetical protein
VKSRELEELSKEENVVKWIKGQKDVSGQTVGPILRRKESKTKECEKSRTRRVD